MVIQPEVKSGIPAVAASGSSKAETSSEAPRAPDPGGQLIEALTSTDRRRTDTRTHSRFKCSREYGEIVRFIDQSGQWGVYSESSPFRLPLRYRFIMPFHGKLALAGDLKSDQCCLVNEHGERVTIYFDRMVQVTESTSVLWNRGLCTLVANNNPVQNGGWYEGYAVSNDVVTMKSETLWAVIGPHGREVGGRYDSIGVFQKQRAHVQHHGRWNIIHANGELQKPAWSPRPPALD